MWLDFHFHRPFGLISHWFFLGPGFLYFYFSEFYWFCCPYFFNFYTSRPFICTAHCLKHSSKIFLAVIFSIVYRQFVRQHKEKLRLIWRPSIYDVWNEHQTIFGFIFGLKQRGKRYCFFLLYFNTKLLSGGLRIVGIANTMNRSNNFCGLI